MLQILAEQYPVVYDAVVHRALSLVLNEQSTELREELEGLRETLDET